jgi:type IV pilus assembly protein PilA
LGRAASGPPFFLAEARVLKSRRGFTLIELMIVVAIIGILTAIAVPNFLKLQGRAKQSEAKAHLKALFQAEKAFFQGHDRYSNLILEVGFLPERGNRYEYFLDALTGPFDDRTGTLGTVGQTASGISVDVFKFPPLTPTAFACGSLTGIANGEFTGGAQGQIDDDSTLDQWTIATASRLISTKCDAQGNVASGEPVNELNDVIH